MAHVNMTLRAYLTAKAALDPALKDTPLLVIMEAVSSTAIEHPEWPMDEERTWEEWETWAR